jgi:SHS family lactate transporter-like MFS transporter
MGNLLAAACYFLLFERFGWRPLFFIGGLPALLALFVRMRVKESEVWEKNRSKSWGQLGSAIMANWKMFLYIALFMMTMNFASHGTQDMFPFFLQRQWHFGVGQRAGVTAVSMVGAIIGGTLCGWYSDRWGRRRTIVAAMIGAIAVVPLWAFAPSMALLFVGAFAMQFFVQGAWGVIPAHLAELSPNSVRGFLPGFGYQCGVLLASSVTYIETVFGEHTSYSVAMAATAATVFVMAAIGAAIGPERRGAEFGT